MVYDLALAQHSDGPLDVSAMRLRGSVDLRGHIESRQGIRLVGGALVAVGAVTRFGLLLYTALKPNTAEVFAMAGGLALTCTGGFLAAFTKDRATIAIAPSR